MQNLAERNNTSKIIQPTAQNIAFVSDQLIKGNVIALPTETVYGLAADATNSNAVAKIYDLKDRPKFNPLIVHVIDIIQAKQIVEFNEVAEILAKKFWPGPLTLVLPLKKNAHISSLVSAGLDTLAIRVPAHPIMQEILKKSGLALAAPSANISGKLSATSAIQVAENFKGKNIYILDGGSSKVGLESTIIDLSSKNPKILRYGGLEPEKIQKNLGKFKEETTGVIRAPGMTTAHYAPNTPVRLNVINPEKDEAYLAFGHTELKGKNILNLSPKADLTEAAANLFDYLAKLDKLGYKKIAVSPIPNIGLGYAINDRLTRAAAAFS